MRLLLITSLVVGLASPLCRADVLLERFNASGFTLEELSYSLNCTLTDTGQLEIERRAGAGLRSHSVEQLQISLNTLKSAIAEAQKGELRSVEPFPVDGPTRSYRAFRNLADGRRIEVILSSEEGNIGRKRLNAAPAATLLMRFMDVHCGPTP